MIRIAVCIKQVPAYDEGGMNPSTGNLNRSGLESVINTYDLSALETALQMKDSHGAEVDVFSMGTADAEKSVSSACIMGADAGYLLTDSRFSGADVTATAYTLMQGMQAVGSYDLILCGSRTTDGDTSQVSGALAALMGMAHLNWVTRIADVAENCITAVQTLEYEELKLQIPFPALISVEREIAVPRMPTLRMRLQRKSIPVHLLTLDDLEDTNEQHYGVKGSSTRVERIFSPERSDGHPLNLTYDAETAADDICRLTAAVRGRLPSW